MMNLKEAFDAAKRHARDEYPRESCGLVVDDGYVPCVNTARPVDTHEAKNPDCMCQLCSFRIPAEIMVKYHGRIQMVLHSHPGGPTHPSVTDAESQIKSGLPWGLIALDDERISDVLTWGDMLPVQPILNRQFVHYAADCFTLIRDAFRLGKEGMSEHGVEGWPYPPVPMKNCPREDGWWEADYDLYTENAPKWGFREIALDHAQPGDVFLTSIRSEKLNHGGVLVGGGMILHHLPGRLSRREPAGIWARAAHKWMRYEGPTDA